MPAALKTMTDSVERTTLLSLVLFALFLGAMWAGSLRVYEHEKMEDALRWRWAELHDEPVYRWPFNFRQELTHGHGVKSFDFEDGVVKGEYPDPYFYLNLEGRYIDAARFTEIRLRLWSPAEDHLRIFHWQKNRHVIHASELVPVSAGWQTLILSLPSLGWVARDLTDAQQTETESSWGGADGVVTALRIDPVSDGAFEVDWIELEDPGRPASADVEVQPYSGMSDPLFERMAQQPDRPWHIAHSGWLRTPETQHWERQKIAEIAPSAIVFPRPPQDDELLFPPLDPVAPSPFLPAFVFIAALLFIVVRDQLPPKARSIVAVIALVALVEAYVYWLPSLSDLWRVLLAVPLLGAVWELAPKLSPRELLGDWRAWLWVSPVIVVCAGLLAFEPLEAYQEYSAGKTLAVYLLWALFQQFVIAVVILGRLQPIIGRQAIVVSAGIFGFLHFPNFALMVATFLLGIGLLHIYQRFSNLPAIAAAHAFLAVGFNYLALQHFWLSRTIGPLFGFAL